MLFFLSLLSVFFFIFFFNATATTEIYTLSLHDALPILKINLGFYGFRLRLRMVRFFWLRILHCGFRRSEEHTSELQSLRHLVCRLLLEKKKKKIKTKTI